MGLDWFTLIAQIINFLVLVWLLRRFLYGRIVRAIEEREASIAGRLDEAARERAAAEREAETWRTRNREFEAQRAEMLARAREEVESRRQELLEEARLQTRNVQAQWMKTLDRERQSLLQDYRKRLSREVLAVASRALEELANEDLEAQVVNVFVDRLRDLDPAERESIIEAIRESDGAVEIRTAFPARPGSRQALSEALRQYLDAEIDARFTVDPELICGIELRTPSHRIPWNFESDMKDLEARVFEALEETASQIHAAAR